MSSGHTELIESVRHWVHFDNLAETLNKQVSNARNLRNEFEKKVLKLLETSNMRNTLLKISGATLQRATRHKPTDLSWTFLEDQLRAFFKEKGRPDETDTILEFLHSRREEKTIEFLKKTVAEAPAKKNPSPS